MEPLVVWWLEVSLPKELQELQDKRIKLEEESRCLKEEQKNLEENVKELEQRTIERLKSANKNTRLEISRLKSMVDDLGQRLSQLPPAQEGSEPSEDTASRSYLKSCSVCGKEIPLASEECQYCGTIQAKDVETMEETVCEKQNVTVRALGGSAKVTQGEIDDKLTQLVEKKKDGFLKTLFR